MPGRCCSLSPTACTPAMPSCTPLSSACGRELWSQLCRATLQRTPGCISAACCGGARGQSPCTVCLRLTAAAARDRIRRLGRQAATRCFVHRGLCLSTLLVCSPEPHALQQSERCIQPPICVQALIASQRVSQRKKRAGSSRTPLTDTSSAVAGQAGGHPSAHHDAGSCLHPSHQGSQACEAHAKPREAGSDGVQQAAELQQPETAAKPCLPTRPVNLQKTSLCNLVPSLCPGQHLSSKMQSHGDAHFQCPPPD